MKDETVLAIVAIIALAVIEAVALIHGIDHALLALVVAVISGLGGYEYRKRKEEI